MVRRLGAEPRGRCRRLSISLTPHATGPVRTRELVSAGRDSPYPLAMPHVMSNPDNAHEPLTLTAHVLDGYQLGLRPAPRERDWMDQTSEPYVYAAYR